MNIQGEGFFARSSNSQGLLEATAGTFREGVASGHAFIRTPGAVGLGTIPAGAIEPSNTDVDRNLADLILAASNSRGNARVINSVQQLIDELLVLGR